MPDNKNIKSTEQTNAKKVSPEEIQKKPRLGIHKAVPILLVAMGIFTAVSFIAGDVGAFGSFLSNFLMGLFAKGAYAIPVLFTIHALFYLSDLEEKRILSRIIFSFIALIALSAMIYGVQNNGTEVTYMGTEYYKAGMEGLGGGLIGSAVGYALSALFGYIGVIIISVAIFAIYVTYFFSKGNKTIRKVVFVTLKAVVTFCAVVEKKIKEFNKSRKEAKIKKLNRKLNEKSRELTNDDFFDVDNGIESLRISELGISETRSRESMEAHPSLHDKVYHKSEFFTDPEDMVNEKDSYTKADFSEPIRKGRKITGDYANDIIVQNTEEDANDFFSKAESTPKSNFSASSDASADDVFVKGFDPFNLAHSEELAYKPSSKSVEEHRGTYSEHIGEITEEDVARARRAAAFERRKAAVIQNAKREAEKASMASSKTEPPAEPIKSPEVTNVSATAIPMPEYRPTPTERTEPTFAHAEPTFESAKVNTAESPTVEYTFAREAANTADPATTFTQEYATTAEATPVTKIVPEENFVHDESETVVEFSEATCPPPTLEEILEEFSDADDKSVQNETHEVSQVDFTPKNEQEEASNDDEPVKSKNNFESSFLFTYSDESDDEKNVANDEIEVEEPITSCYTTADEEKHEPLTFEFKEYEVEEEEEEPKPGLVFEVEGEIKECANEEPQVISVERTKLSTVSYDESVSNGLPFEDSDDEDDEDLTEEPDDYEDDESFEEIPPEKQNPKIMEYRDMFKMYRKEDAETEKMEPEIQNSAEDIDDDIEASEIEEDIEEPLPFERETLIIQRKQEEPVRQKSEPPKAEENASNKPDYSNYQFPPLDLLEIDEVTDDDEISNEIEQNKNTLIETLASFNVTASIKGVDRGPRVTRYEIVPARGVKVNAITNLFDNIALNLAAEGIRMEAPIPGKSAIGFEIPNKRAANVRLRELLECEEFVNAKSKTFVCIGKDVGGNPVFGDIGKFPHALVAGATGMGKSVCINSIMISLLYKARPDEVKFIMIDPKKVEFRMYSGIPHLLIPVITEAKQAAGALMWAVEEMERRYGIIEQLNIKNIDSYNEKCVQDKSLGEPMPKIVIVIDELNDLMMQVRDPVEDLIMRIAQKARAAGIHLIIGTQRPDVKVVTGTIKANINTRISCKVTSVMDSRTILEMAGAEKLLNRGDMLFKPVDKTKPIRVQGCFVSDPEVEGIMDFLKAEASGNIYDDEVFAEINKAAQKCGNKKSQGGLDDDMDDGDGEVGYYGDQQFLDAVELAIRSGKVSTSLLQRKLSIGYGKAAKFIDAMEDIGIVSPQNGQKPRDILFTIDEWHERLSRVNFDD